MVLFDDTVELASGRKINLKIPGGNDKVIYENHGRTATNYRLGDDGCYYNLRSGSKVAGKMSVPEFAKLHIHWYIKSRWKSALFVFAFYFQKNIIM